ncbi:MAG TPA: choice-of-anchor Q domain-containing protein [Anaerolineae bacterium]|nr:choice-of-anchor Q domain-containing protein [Anaerolineae bacterium]
MKRKWYLPYLLSLSGLLLLLTMLSTSNASASSAIIDLTAQCPSGIGDVTALINAINTANTNGNPSNTIILANDCVYTLTSSNNNTTLGPTALPIITSALTINGNNSTFSRNSANHFRLLTVDAPGNLSLYDLTLTGGLAQAGAGTNGQDAGGGGGGAGGGGALLIYAGNVYAENVHFTNNEGRGGNGGAGGGQSNPDVAGVGGAGSPAIADFKGGNGTVFNGGNAESSIFGGGGGSGACLSGGCPGLGVPFSPGTSTYAGNGSPGNAFGGGSGDGGGGAGLGGAVLVYNGSLTIMNSAFTNNLTYRGTRGPTSAQDGGALGGAIFNYAGTIIATNTTFSDNQANGAKTYGGALFNYQGNVTTYNVTFGSNTMTQSSITGENIYNALAPASLTLNNTIVAGPTSALTNNAGTVTATNRNNIIETGFSGAGIINANPLLAPLNNNLGSTPTQGLLMTSPAIDAGNNSLSNGAVTDQRGFARIEYGGISTNVDIGAYELIDTHINIAAINDPNITDAEIYDAGTTIKGSPFTIDFTITNQATAVGTLELDPTTVVLNSTGFTILSPNDPFGGNNILLPGESTTLQIQVDALADGVRQSTLSFYHNGTPDYVAYDINLLAEIYTPEIEVSANGTVITDDISTVVFGTTTANNPITQTFTITNLEAPALLLSNLTLPADFTLVTPFPTTINPGASADFQIRFDAPASAGTYSGPVQFTTNDETENPFNFTITAYVSAPQDPGVVGPTIRLSDIGGLGEDQHSARGPAIAYNATDDIFLIVWEADDQALYDYEIYGQLINGTTGAEIGTNDFPVIADANPNLTIRKPKIVWNSLHNEFLVVAYGDLYLDGRNEIIAQRLDGTTGALIGTPFQVTDNLGGAGTDFDARDPDVAYNATNDEYFVVWEKDKNYNNAFEVWGRRIYGNAATGNTIGNDIRISDSGADDTNTNYGIAAPRIVWNSTANEYMVVWYGNDDTGSMALYENEIFGQRLSATGAEIGTNDFRISAMNTDGNDVYSALLPAIAYNETHNEYLVVWVGYPGAPLADYEYEIFGQRLDTNGLEVGNDDFRISDMGPDNSTAYIAYQPQVAYTPYFDEYAVVWYGDDDVTPLIDNDNEVFLQRIAGDRTKGDEVGNNDIRISQAGPPNDTNYFVFNPTLTFGRDDGPAFIIWSGGDTVDGMVLYEQEIFGQQYQIPLTSKCGAQLDSYVFYQTTNPVTININSLGNINCVTVTPFAINHPNATVGIQTGRYWTIEATDTLGNPATAFNVTLTLPYASANSNSRLCRWPGGLGGDGWDCDDGTNTSFTTGFVTRANVTNFSDWAVGDNVGPTAVTLQSAHTTATTHPYLPAIAFLLLLTALTLYSYRLKKAPSA